MDEIKEYDSDGEPVFMDNVLESHSRRMLPTALPENNTWSNEEARDFGGYDFVRVSVESHRAFSFLQEKAQAAIWLQDVACRALIQQNAPQRRAIFRLLEHAQYALRGFETRDESQAWLEKLGQKVLSYERTVKKVRSYGGETARGRSVCPLFRCKRRANGICRLRVPP